jgi:hypothetical protein
MKALRLYLIGFTIAASIAVLAAQQPVTVANSPTVSISGTVPISAASLPLPSGASTSAKQPALGTAGSASSDVITVQGIASMTKLLVTPDSVALPAHQSTNVDQWNGTTTDTNSGNKSAGTLRVVLATDQPALTNKLLVTPDANSAVNLAQVAGATTATSASGVQKVGVVGNAGAALDAATGAAPPANAVYVAGLQSGATGGFLGGITVCDSDKEINVTANTQLIAGVSGRKIRVCAIQLVAAAATNVAIVTGTGSTCGTGTTALMGGTTAATGWNFAANGGIAFGSGLGEVATAHNAADNLCILVSAANQISGSIKYTIY